MSNINYNEYDKLEDFDDFVIAPNNIERVRVSSATGNVGIGVRNPKYKLEVEGTINAKEVLINEKPISASGSAISGFPSRIGEVEFGIATIPANGTYTYTFDLNDEYQYVLVRNLRWVSGRGFNKDLPSFNFGVASFSKEWNPSLLVSKDECRRLFELNTLEYKNGQQINAKLYNKVQDVGCALGYGDMSKDVFLDHIDAFGKHFVLENVYLSNNNSKINFVIRNEEIEDIDLQPYDAVNLINLIRGAYHCYSILCLGDNLVVLSTFRYSVDKGKSFTLKSSGILQPYTSACVSGYTKDNQYFISFLQGYNYTLYLSVTNNLGDSYQSYTFPYPSGFWLADGHYFLFKERSKFFIGFINNQPVIYKFNNDLSGYEVNLNIYGSPLFPDAENNPPYRDDKQFIYENNGNIYAIIGYGTSSQLKYKLIRSATNGSNWEVLKEYQNDLHPLNPNLYSFLRFNGNKLFIAFIPYVWTWTGEQTKVIFNISEDGGNSWIYNDWQEFLPGFMPQSAEAFIYDGNILLLLGSDSPLGIYGYRSTDNGQTWQQFTLERSFTDRFNYFIHGYAEYASRIFAVFLCYLHPSTYVYNAARITSFLNLDLWGIK